MTWSDSAGTRLHFFVSYSIQFLLPIALQLVELSHPLYSVNVTCQIRFPEYAGGTGSGSEEIENMSLRGLGVNIWDSKRCLVDRFSKSYLSVRYS